MTYEVFENNLVWLLTSWLEKEVLIDKFEKIKFKWKKEYTRKFILKMYNTYRNKVTKGNKLTIIDGYKIYSNDCFQPNIHNISKIFISKIPKQKYNNILDIWTWTGILSILLSKYWKQITAIDNDNKSLKTAKKNVKWNNIKNIRFLQSNLFNSIPKIKFDIIIMNPPFFDYCKEIDKFWALIMCKNFWDLFFWNIKNYILQKSKIYILFSNLWNYLKLERKIQEYWFKFKIIHYFYIFPLWYIKEKILIYEIFTF
jgi:16S rRNA G966 N2-methylase RsmD